MTTSPDTDWLDVLQRTLAAAPETWPAMVTEHDGIDLAKAFYDAWRPKGARLLAMLTPISDPELVSWQTRAARVAEQLEARILSRWSGAPERDPRGCSPAHALFMAHAIKNGTDGVDSDTKACRWLGWLQCLCAVHRFATLEEMKQMNVNSKNASGVQSVGTPPDEQSPEQKAATLPQEPAPGSTESDAAFFARIAYETGRLEVDAERLLALAKRTATSPDDAVAAVERLLALTNRLRLVEDNDCYASVWTVAAMHGVRYNGPTYEKELKDAESFLRTLPSTKPSPSDLIRRLDHLLHDMCDEGSADDRWHAEQAHEHVRSVAAHLAPEPEIRECARNEAAERKEAIEALRERCAAEPITLADCPIGLFITASSELCLKTEYGSNEGRIDAYIVSTGEFFWGALPQTIESQRAQMVRPLYAAPPKPEPAPRSARTRGRPMTRTREEIFGLAVLALSAALYVPSILICGPVIAWRHRRQMRRYGR